MKQRAMSLLLVKRWVLSVTSGAQPVAAVLIADAEILLPKLGYKTSR